MGRKKTTEEFKKDVYNLVNDEYTVLGEYIKNSEKIILLHNMCNSKFEMTPNNFLRGQRCPNCCTNKNTKKTTDEFKKEVFDTTGNEYTVLSDYKGTNIKVLMKHNNCGHEYLIKPNYFINNGRRCPNCAKITRGNKRLKTKETFNEEIFSLFGDEYTVLSDYKGVFDKIQIQHNDCGNIYNIRPNNLLRGQRCPKCSLQGTSMKEKVLIDFIKEIYDGTVIENDRLILDGKELDIYLPELSIAIEFDGLYWHSELYNDSNYHLNKTIMCQEKGIRLIHIFEDELDNSLDIVKDKIINIMGLTNNVIYARKCYIKEISSKEKNNFLNNNHIQGADKCSIKLGLFYLDNLVAVMTFSKPNISKGQTKDSIYDYELSRYAGLINHSIVGGFSKLFKYFERNYEWNKIITYADIRYSEGNVYIKNNFVWLRNSKPNYWYFKSTNTSLRKHRYNYRKNKLKIDEEFRGIYSGDKTEKEIMRESGYLRIYDCGNFVFEYNK